MPDPETPRVDASHASGVYVGLMSGTSLDGISAAVVHFEDGADGRIAHDLVGFSQSAYAPAQRDRLAAAMRSGSAEEYCALGFELGEWFAEAAIAAMRDARVDPGDVRAIASHGQTLWHIPARATWQAGESAVIAERTGVDVVSDFRVRDVAAGGEGAPLVPIADALLYADAAEWRLLQNLGGMGNVSAVPPGGDVDRVRAFDTGPGVAIIDAVVRSAYPGMRFDVDGQIARRGRVVQPVLDALLDDPYFAQRPPKSTGRERYGIPYAEMLLARCLEHSGASEDAVATAVALPEVAAALDRAAVALTAESIGRAYRDFVPESGRVVLSGGGARNPALVAAIRAAVSPRDVQSFDALYYDGDAKESVAFALLAHLHVTRRAGNVTGATGARGPRLLGKLTPA